MQPKEPDQLRLDHHQDFSSRSLVSYFDELIYYAQVMQHKESDQLRMDRHEGLSAQSLVAD